MGDVRVSEDVVTQVVQTAVLRPGDTLIVRVPLSTTRSALEQLMAGLRERLPEVPVVVLGAEEMVVYRSEPPLYTVQVTPPADVEAALAEHVQRAASQSAQRRRTG